MLIYVYMVLLKYYNWNWRIAVYRRITLKILIPLNFPLVDLYCPASTIVIYKQKRMRADNEFDMQVCV